MFQEKRFLQGALCLNLTLFPFLSQANEATPSPSAFEQIIPFVIIGLIFYFLLIRPQQKKYKQHTEFLSQIKRGDEILTNSGIFGKIEGITDQFIVLEIADSTRIRILKSQISSFAQDVTMSKQEK